MGNVVNTMMRRVSKPVKEFNLESRVEKVILKKKPDIAPRHPRTQTLLSKDESTEINKQLNEADSELLKRLQQVYVTSQEKQTLNASKTRPMPQAKTHFEKTAFGYHEPKVIPYGKLTLKDALDIISRHQESPKEWTAKRIAEEWKLDTSLMEKVLKYYSTFTLVVPPSKAKEKTPLNIPVSASKNLGASSVVYLPREPDPEVKST